MEKKIYFEQLRKSLADMVSPYEPRTTVSYDLNLSALYVVFPPERLFISNYLFNAIRKAGGEISVGYYRDHMEVTVHVLYIE